VNKHFELEIKTLQNAPRDADKLRTLLKSKERQKEEADHIEDTERLVTEEIEILKVVLLSSSRCTRAYIRNQRSLKPRLPTEHGSHTAA
jgi:hypothetical protein